MVLELFLLLRLESSKSIEGISNCGSGVRYPLCCSELAAEMRLGRKGSRRIT